MIPFFGFEKIMIGPVAIHVWGLMVAIGIGAAVFYAYKLAGRYFLSQAMVVDMTVWIVVGAFIGARLFYVFFYNPAYEKFPNLKQECRPRLRLQQRCFQF